LVLSGGNPNLRPETANIWTAGFDLTPKSLAGLSASATYFDLDYRNKIATGGFGGDTLLFEQQWAPIITRNPTQEQVDSICSRPDFLSSECPPVVDVILDLRLRNLGGLLVRGIDFDVGYRSSDDRRLGALAFGITGTYMLKYQRSVTVTSPATDILDTTYNPISIRLRARAGWTSGSWSANAFLNYAGSYRNPSDSHRVGSWITADTSIGYQIARDGWLEGTRFQLSAINLFDKQPSFVDQSGGYDQSNANELGRSISLEISKIW
ncbi:MAG: TonB-dependent receptor domain-containing protein, partial [Candidatus Binatia bacterium]